MSIPARNGPGKGPAEAKALRDLGMPVFAGRLDSEGNPDRADRRWLSWQKTKPGATVRYREGDALCAVTGVTFDVIDIDPRNGGDKSAKRLTRDLGDDGPEVYGKVKTASGGLHLYIAPLGIGTVNGFLPGIDLKGGKPDGSSRGFVFIPPTVRPSKVSGKPKRYELTLPFATVNGHGPCGALAAYVADQAGTANGTGEIRNGSRRPVSELERACLEAAEGEQRGALLKYVHEMERTGLSERQIIATLKDLVAEMPVYDARKPWYPAHGSRPDAHLRGLLHAPGAVIPDATEEEMAGEFAPIVSRDRGDYVSADDIAEERVDWLNNPFLPFGCLVIIDGDPGQGKSTLTTGIVARSASGLPALPFGEPSRCGPIHCGMIGAEDDIGQAVIGRLRAAGYVSNRHVWFMRLKKKRGKIELLTFPEGTGRVRDFIRANELRLLVVDPISSFLGEDVNSHNEASVRKALAPLAEIARETGCCIILVRHLNKDGSMKAMYRGGGSIAFSAIARSGIVTGVAPDGSFGLAQVKCSYSERFPGAIAYNISRWEEDPAIPVIDFGERLAIDADTLVRGPGARRGPEPVSQTEIGEVLEDLFAERDTWPVGEAMAELKAAGVSTHKETVRKAREKAGIRAYSEHKRGRAGFARWFWTTKKERIGGDGGDSDD